MAHVNSDSRSDAQRLNWSKMKHIHTHIGCRLVSDVEAAVAPSLQFCPPIGSTTPPQPCTSAGTSLELTSPRIPSHVFSSHSWGTRGSRLTGNVFVDYRRFGVRRLEDLQELQRSREAEAIQSLSLNSYRALSRLHSAAVTRLSLDCTRRYLLSSSRDGSIALYDLEADAAFNLNGGFGPKPKVYPIGYVQRRPDRPPKRNLLPLRFQPASGRRVVRECTMRSEAGNISALSEGFANAKRAQSGHSRSVTSVEFMPGDNGLFVSTGLDKLLKIWDTHAWECVLDITVESPILCCAFDRVGFQSMTAFSSRAHSSTGSVERSVNSPAHLSLATGCQDGSIRIFDVRCGAAQQTLLGHKGAVLSVAWDPATPCQLFSGSSDKSIRKWDIRRNDACVVLFDKGKPDLDFLRNRCTQSAAFRQLLYTYDVVGGSFFPTPVLSCEALGPPPSMRFAPNSFKDHGAPLDMVAKAASDAAFAHETSFSLPTPSPMSSAFSLATSEACQAKTLHPQISVHLKKRNCNLADARVRLGCEVKKLRKEEPKQEEYLPSYTKQARLCGSLRGQQRYQKSTDVMGDTVQVQETRNSPAVLKRGTSGDSAGSAMSTVLNMASDRAPNNDDDLQGHTLQTSGNRRKTTPKRRLYSSATVSPRKCRQAGPGLFCVNAENVKFSAQIPVLHTPTGVTPSQKRPNQREATEGTRRTVCSPLDAEREPDSGGDGMLKTTEEALHANGRPVYHADSLCLERNKHGSVYATVSSCRDGISADASIISGQLLCGLERGRSKTTLPGDTERILEKFGVGSSTDSKFFLHGGGRSFSTANGQNGWSEVSAHEGAVTCLLPCPDGTHLVSSGNDGRIRLWNALSGSHCFVHMILNIPRVNSALVSVQEPRHSRMPGAPARPEKSKTVMNDRYGSIWGVQAAMSKSGEYLLHGRGRVLCTFDIISGAEVQITAPGHGDDIVCVTWNDDKNEAYSGAFDGSVLIYDAMCGYTSEDDAAEEADGEDIPVVDVRPPELS